VRVLDSTPASAGHGIRRTWRSALRPGALRRWHARVCVHAHAAEQPHLLAPSSLPEGPGARALRAMAGLDLGSFILRARVLNLYREALRTVRRAPPHTHGAPAARRHTRSRTHAHTATQCAAHASHSRRAHTLPRLACAGELRGAVRQAMDAGRDARGKDQIKFYLSEGKQRLKELTDMLGLAVVLPQAASGGGAATAPAPATGAARVVADAAARAAKPSSGGCGTPGHRH
jgi:hypothetical protein